MANLSHLPEKWRASGLSQRAFCEREGINPGTFAYWRAKELKPQVDPVPSAFQSTPGGFAELVVAPASVLAPTSERCIEIRCPGGLVISIPL